MTLEKAKQELEKFVQLKTTLRPSFVDVLLNAEEVVRCKDCKWYKRKYSLNGHAYTECTYLDAPMDDNDYCSLGERKDEVEDGASDN